MRFHGRDMSRTDIAGVYRGDVARGGWTLGLSGDDTFMSDGDWGKVRPGDVYLDSVEHGRPLAQVVILGMYYSPGFAVPLAERSQLEDEFGNELEYCDVEVAGNGDRAQQFTIVRPRHVLDLVESLLGAHIGFDSVRVQIAHPPDDMCFFRLGGGDVSWMWFYTERFVEFCRRHSWTGLAGWRIWEGASPVMAPSLLELRDGAMVQTGEVSTETFDQDRRGESPGPALVATGRAASEIFRFAGYPDSASVVIEDNYGAITEAEPVDPSHVGEVWYVAFDEEDGGSLVEYSIVPAGSAIAVRPAVADLILGICPDQISLVEVDAMRDDQPDASERWCLVQPRLILEVLDEARTVFTRDGRVAHYEFTSLPEGLCLFRIAHPDLFDQVFFTDLFVDGCRRSRLSGLNGLLLWSASRPDMAMERCALT